MAEKLAALEVVKSRLARAGLDPFVLKLHSNKANKKRVLEDLTARVNLRVANTRELPELLERREQKRKELKAYADLMNSKVCNQLELTLHQVMWRSELNRARCGDAATVVQNLDYAAATHTALAQLAALCDRLRYLAGQLKLIGTYGPAHPLWGFFPTEFRPEDDLPVQRVLGDFADRFEAFTSAMSKATQLLGGSNLNMSANSVEQLVTVLSSVAPSDASDVAFHLLPKLFPAEDPQGARGHATLLRLLERAKHIGAMRAEVQRHLKPASPSSPALASAAKEVLLGLKTRGLAIHGAESLTAKRERLQKASDEAHAALKTLRSFADLVSIEFAGTTYDVQRLNAVARAVQAAPRDHIHLQHRRSSRAGHCSEASVGHHNT